MAYTAGPPLSPSAGRPAGVPAEPEAGRLLAVAGLQDVREGRAAKNICGAIGIHPEGHKSGREPPARARETHQGVA